MDIGYVLSLLHLVKYRSASIIAIYNDSPFSSSPSSADFAVVVTIACSSQRRRNHTICGRS